MILTKAELLNRIEEDIEHTEKVIDTLVKNDKAISYMAHLLFMQNYVGAIADITDDLVDKEL